MIKLSLECYQTTRHHHILSHAARSIHRTPMLPNLYFATSSLTLLLNNFITVPPRCAIHYIKEPPRIQLVQTFENFVYLNQIRPKKSCFLRRLILDSQSFRNTQDPPAPQSSS